MDNQFISIFEQMKKGETVDDELLLSNKKEIVEWYCQYFDSCSSINDALDLMYFFYIHDNLDVYHATEYQHQCSYLKENFSLSSDKVLNAIQSFRKLVYEG